MSLLGDISAAAAAALTANAFFSPAGSAAIPVFSANRGDIANELDIKLGKLGLALVVSVGDVESDGPDAPGPRFGRINLNVEAHEMPPLNRSNPARPTALDAVEAAAAVLHHYQMPVTGCGMLTCTGIGPVAFERGVLTYSARFRLAGGLATADRPGSAIVTADDVRELEDGGAIRFTEGGQVP